MRRLPTLLISLVLLLALSGVAVAGETQCPPGELTSPPAAGNAIAGETNSPPGETNAPPGETQGPPFTSVIDAIFDALGL